VHVAGAGLLDVFYWETEPGVALHLLNYTSPALLKAPRERSPRSARRRFVWALPQGFHPAKVSLLHARKEVPFRVTGSELASPSHKSVNMRLQR